MFDFLKGDSKKDEEIEKLKDQLDVANSTIKTMRKQKNDMAEYIEELSEKHEEKVEKLEGRIEVLEGLKNESIKLQKKEIDLETKQALLDAKTSSAVEVKKQLEVERSEYAEELEKRQRGWYADGLADGLRKVHEITAEDRKQAMQVAALAASSHTPDAAAVIADGIRNEMVPAKALGAGKKK